MEKDKSLNEVEMFRNEVDKTLLILKIKVLENGNLSMEGQDIGEAPKVAFGHDDYEYTVTVPAEFKDRLLLLLIKERFTSGTPSSEFMEWLKSQNIPHTFSSWP